jgi:hypothetical protein
MHSAVLSFLLGATLSVELPVYLRAEIPPTALERALAEADRLFEAGGIRFQWRLSPPGHLASAPATIVVLPRPENPVVSGCSRDLHDHRLGHTHLGARRVTLWTEQVARAVAGSWDRQDAPRVQDETLGIALGRVLAHELGHLFLRLNGHRENGLMKPSFSQRSLVGKSDRSFRLSEEDLERVRGVITRLQASSDGARRALLAER